MRLVALLVIAACGGAPPPAPSAPAVGAKPAPAPKPAVAEDKLDFERVDPMLALAPPARDAKVSWVTPGQARLEVAASPIEYDVANAPPVAVTIIDAQGRLVRLAVRLPHARFSLWTDRARLYAIVQREQRVRVGHGPDLPNQFAPTLFPGARVMRLAKKDGWTQIRYLGALQVEGWVPNAALGDRGVSRAAVGRIPTGMKTLTLLPGSIIRRAPQFSGEPLALAANNYFVDIVRELDPKWFEVHYMDGDLGVRGYYQRYSPPGRLHRPKVDPNTAPIPIAPNAKVANGTCLYARAGGEPIGYIVGEREVALDATTNGWWTLAIDTPWGPIAFATRGPTDAELETCVPSAP